MLSLIREGGLIVDVGAGDVGILLLRRLVLVIRHLQQQLAKQYDIHIGILGAISIESLTHAEVDHARLQQESLESFDIHLLQEWVLLVEHHMRDVNRRGPNILKLLLELKEPILDLLLYVLWQLFLCAEQLWILRVAGAFQNP